MTAKLLVTGATGTIGTRLVAALGGARVLSRTPGRVAGMEGAIDARRWDGRAALDADVFAGVEAIVHLAGEPVGEGRWTARKKLAIQGSRVEGTRALVASLRAAGARPAVLVCASAVGYYGDRGEETLDETSAPGRGFLAEVCRAWEGEALAARALGVRVICVRTGVVLDIAGGALPRMVLPFRVGVGGPLGSGRQWVPWIHVADVVRLVAHAIARPDVEGPINAVAPAPVRNAEFARALGAVLHRPALVRAPAFALRAALGEAAELALASQRVVPALAERSGFSFSFPALPEALSDLLAPPR